MGAQGGRAGRQNRRVNILADEGAEQTVECVEERWAGREAAVAVVVVAEGTVEVVGATEADDVETQMLSVQ